MSHVKALSVEVRGIPAGQGSKRHVGNGRMIESSTRVAPWRADVKAAVEAAMPADWEPITGPVMVTMVAWFPRPKSHMGTGKNAALVKNSAPVYPHGGGQPDLDKVLRSTFDALTAAGVWRDDCQVAEVVAKKRWADGFAPGARVIVQELAS